MPKFSGLDNHETSELTQRQQIFIDRDEEFGVPGNGRPKDWNIQWISAEVTGGGDWSDLLRFTAQPRGEGLADLLERAVRPYFDEAVGLLAGARDPLDGLTELALAHPPGLGRRALRRFFAGTRHSRWAAWLDSPRVRWAAYTEAVREISDT